ncbi:hypothetical protein C8R45DRAFT_934944 [Mycena sanguinolenta]|nr:hypothetical protein C8R45DRAFT_934944 [Mycena sanguinolenta]
MIILPSLLALYALAHTPGCSSALSNRTIDDAYGDAVTGLLPTYGPPNAPWRWVVPDAAETLDNSWHDVTVADGATYTVTIQFTGMAIYFYGIVPNLVPGAPVDRTVNLTFGLDDAFTGSYIHVPDPTTAAMMYHFALDGLSNNTHMLVAQAQSSSWLFFDYAIYTFEDGEAVATSTTTAPVESGSANSSQNSSGQTAASSRSHFPTAIVVGSICGVLGVISLAGVVWRKRGRRYRNGHRGPNPLEPFLAGQGQAPPSGWRAKIHMHDSRQLLQSHTEETATMLPPYTPRVWGPGLKVSS